MARPGTFTTGHAVSAAELNALGRVYTSGTRPTGADVYEGLEIWETDTDRAMMYDGANWCHVGKMSGALTTYTPTLTQSATPSKTVNRASYQRTGRSITGGVKMTATSGGTANNAIVVGLPVASLVTSDMVIGSGSLWDASVSAWYPFHLMVNSATTARLLDSAAAWVGPLFLGQTGTSMGSALASGDIITFSFAYEAAAD